MGHWRKQDATYHRWSFCVPQPCMPICMSCLRQCHLHPDSIASSQLFYQEADVLCPFLRATLAEPRRRRGWLILRAEEGTKWCLVLRLGKTPGWDSDLSTLTQKPFVQPMQMQCEQFMCIPYHPARHFIASTIAGKWLLRSHTAFSWSTNHFVRAFYCPFTP